MSKKKFKMPTVELRDKEFTLEPLGIETIYELIEDVEKISSKVVDSLGVENFDITKTGQLSKMKQIKIALIAFKKSKEEVYRILEELLGVDEEELKDRNKFPPSTVVKVVKVAYNEHPDIVEFRGVLKNAFKGEIMEKIKEMKDK